MITAVKPGLSGGGQASLGLLNMLMAFRKVYKITNQSEKEKLGTHRLLRSKNIKSQGHHRNIVRKYRVALIAVPKFSDCSDFLSDGAPGLDQYSSEATISSAAILDERNISLAIENKHGLLRDVVASAVYYWQTLESSDKTD